MKISGLYPFLFVTLLGSSVVKVTAEETLRGDVVMQLSVDRGTVIGHTLRNYYLSSPSTYNFADSISISSAYITADILRLDEAVMAQNGTGHNLYSVTADSYYKLSKRSTVWGHAGYYNGKKNNILFSDVIDYSLVGPYITADEDGGDLSLQRYTFGGGWTKMFGSWTVGLQADYRAEIAHRAIDPRVRNIVSDLSIDIGGARKLNRKYYIGLNAGILLYQQDTDIDFYRPSAHTIIQVLSGLGSTSSRFEGTKAQSSSHKLTAYKTSLQLVPVTHSNSFYALVEASVANNSLLLHDYSNLTFGTTATTLLSASLSHRFSFSDRFILFPTIRGKMWERTGKENLFGASVDKYEKIGERENYKHTRTEASICIPLSFNPVKNKSIALSLEAGYVSDNEKLLEPARSLKVDYISYNIVLEGNCSLGKRWNIGARIDAGGHKMLSTSAQWGGLDLTKPVGAMTLHNYQMASTNLTSQMAGINLSRSFNKIIATVSASLQHYDFKNHGEGNTIVGALSLTF